MDVGLSTLVVRLNVVGAVVSAVEVDASVVEVKLSAMEIRCLLLCKTNFIYIYIYIYIYILHIGLYNKKGLPVEI